MINFIQKATAEFEQNGRSKKFVAMENRIAKRCNAMQIYFFARYARGANVAKLQDAMLEKCTLEEGYYFYKNAVGADITLFFEKVIASNNAFWVEKYIEVAKDKKEYSKIKDMASTYPRVNMKAWLEGANTDVNNFIGVAQAEYERNGRSELFKKYEQYAVHQTSNSYSGLFYQNVEGCDPKVFEREAILRGDPFNMYILATECKYIDRALMLVGLEMAQLDYRVVDATYNEQKERKLNLKQKMDPLREKIDYFKANRDTLTLEQKLQFENDLKEYNKLSISYNDIPDQPEYISDITLYISGVQYLYKREGIYKK